jgi:hypothetical protein
MPTKPTAVLTPCAFPLPLLPKSSDSVCANSASILRVSDPSSVRSPNTRRVPEHYKHYTLGDLEWLVVPPMLAGRPVSGRDFASGAIFVGVIVLVASNMPRKTGSGLKSIALRPICAITPQPRLARGWPEGAASPHTDQNSATSRYLLALAVTFPDKYNF